jgi:hypothetical protein
MVNYFQKIFINCKIKALQLVISQNIRKNLRTKQVEFDNKWSATRKIIELEEGIRLDRMNEIYRIYNLTVIPQYAKEYCEFVKLAEAHRKYEEIYLTD